MTATRQRLHTLVDMVEETGLDTLYNVMVRFIPEDVLLPDEIIAHNIAMNESLEGEVLTMEDINWD